MIYGGYSGVLWRTVYDTLAYYTQQLNLFTGTTSGTAPSYAALAQMSEAMFSTLRNGVEAIDVQAMSDAWSNEVTSLQEIQALPLSLASGVALIINNRITAYENALAGVNAIVPAAPYGSAADIASGIASIPNAGLLNYFEAFSYETAPSGLTSANLVTNAVEVANAFQDLANAISIYQGSNITQLYDVADREYLCAAVTAQTLQDLTSGGFAVDITTTNAWNQIVSLPAMSMCADIINGAPLTETLQQRAVLRNVMLETAINIALFILSLDQPVASQINLATLRNNETLMDLAARTLGDYTQWETIAALNGLYPPYVGATASSGVAAWGTQLVLPTPGVSGSLTGTTPNYLTNFLGVDLYTGPINGSMPTWAGDFQTIAGYENLAWALGRRLQTTQGSLIYHRAYGSRIPPEVGNVQTNETAGHITAFGKSAILSDPRVASVTSAVTRIMANSLVSFTADVQPSGFESNAVTLNEVIGNLP